LSISFIPEVEIYTFLVLDNFGLADNSVVAIYLYGSRVYGTQGIASDWVIFCFVASNSLNDIFLF